MKIMEIRKYYNKMLEYKKQKSSVEGFKEFNKIVNYIEWMDTIESRNKWGLKGWASLGFPYPNKEHPTFNKEIWAEC